jgi:malonate transporter
VLHVLLVTFPFFALVLAGYIAARQRMLPLEAIRGMNTFVLFFRAALHAVPLWRQHAIAQLLDGRCSSPTCSVRW